MCYFKHFFSFLRVVHVVHKGFKRTFDFSKFKKGCPKGSEMIFLAKKQVFQLKCLVKYWLTASEKRIWAWNNNNKVLFMIQCFLQLFFQKWDVGSVNFDFQAKMDLRKAFGHPFLQFARANFLLKYLYELL